MEPSQQQPLVSLGGCQRPPLLGPCLLWPPVTQPEWGALVGEWGGRGRKGALKTSGAPRCSCPLQSRVAVVAHTASGSCHLPPPLPSCSGAACHSLDWPALWEGTGSPSTHEREGLPGGGASLAQGGSLPASLPSPAWAQRPVGGPPHPRQSPISNVSRLLRGLARPRHDVRSRDTPFLSLSPEGP